MTADVGIDQTLTLRPLERARPIAEEDYPISQCPDRGMPSSVVVSRPGRTGNQVCMRVQSIGFFVFAGVEAGNATMTRTATPSPVQGAAQTCGP